MSFNINLKRLIKLAAESVYAYSCCPECGAPLRGKAFCEYCGAPAPKWMTEKIIDTVLKLHAEKVLGEKIDRLEIKIDEIKKSIYGELKVLDSLANQAILSGIPTNVFLESMRLVLMGKEIPEEIRNKNPKLFNALEDIGNSLKKYGVFYRARKHREAVKYFAKAMSSLMTESSGKEAKYALSLPFVNGSFDVSFVDINGDGNLETIWIPSKEMGSIVTNGIILDFEGKELTEYLAEHGISIDPQKSQILPLQTDIGVFFAIWENANLLDIKLFIDDKVIYVSGKYATVANFYGLGDRDVVVPSNRGISIITPDGKKDNFFTGDVKSMHILDYDGDGNDEILVISLSGNIFLIDNGVGNRMNRIGSIKNFGMLTSVYIGDKEVPFLLSSEGIYQLDNLPVLIYQLQPREQPLGITKLRINRTEYLAYLYAVGGSLRIKLFEEVTEEGVSFIQEKEKEIDVLMTLPPGLKSITFERGEIIPDYPSSSRWFLKAHDFDGDGVDELFLGTKNLFMGIELKFE